MIYFLTLRNRANSGRTRPVGKSVLFLLDFRAFYGMGPSMLQKNSQAGFTPGPPSAFRLPTSALGPPSHFPKRNHAGSCLKIKLCPRFQVETLAFRGMGGRWNVNSPGAAVPIDPKKAQSPTRKHRNSLPAAGAATLLAQRRPVNHFAPFLPKLFARHPSDLRHGRAPKRINPPRP